ncbi:MAG TPA: riboflavin synthase [Actinomycetota bacterium]|nr:riboflavin synthase [Actinomycetota bacterium]
MFTGIISERGVVKRARLRGGALNLEIGARATAHELGVGDSVSVNGVCLTATSASRRRFEIQAIAETVARSTLGSLARNSAVNLELPVRPADRLGGHLVQGHVDGVARVTRVEPEDGALRVWLRPESALLRYIVEKGSVALDGVSLTVVETGIETFQVALIPHTLGQTTLDELQRGSAVNVEVDLIAKYVERLSRPHSRPERTGHGL